MSEQQPRRRPTNNDGELTRYSLDQLAQETGISIDRKPGTDWQTVFRYTRRGFVVFLAAYFINDVLHQEDTPPAIVGDQVLPTLMALPSPTVTHSATQEAPTATAPVSTEVKLEPTIAPTEGVLIKTDNGCFFTFGGRNDALFDKKKIGFESNEDPGNLKVIEYTSGGIQIPTQATSIRLYPYIEHKQNADGSWIYILREPTMIPFDCEG